MPYCPKCRFEYVEGIKCCPDCDVDLVDALEPEKPAERKREEPLQLVTIATFNYPPEAEMAKLKLESAGIEAVIANDIVARMYWPASIFDGIKVQVRTEDMERARKTLQSSE